MKIPQLSVKSLAKSFGGVINKVECDHGLPALFQRTTIESDFTHQELTIKLVVHLRCYAQSPYTWGKSLTCSLGVEIYVDSDASKGNWNSLFHHIFDGHYTVPVSAVMYKSSEAGQIRHYDNNIARLKSNMLDRVVFEARSIAASHIKAMKRDPLVISTLQSMAIEKHLCHSKEVKTTTRRL